MKKAAYLFLIIFVFSACFESNDSVNLSQQTEVMPTTNEIGTTPFIPTATVSSTPILISPTAEQPTNTPLPLINDLPKGDYLVTSSGRNLLIRDIEGEIVRVIPVGFTLEAASINQDTMEMIYATKNYQIGVLNLNSMESSVYDQFYRVPIVNWSPDGSMFVFASFEPSEHNEMFTVLSVYHLETGELQKLSDENISAGSPIWSPNGKYIAFKTDQFAPHIAQNELYIFNANCIENKMDCLKKIQKMSKDDFMVYGYTWSPNGNEIAYGCYEISSGKGGICLQNIDTGEFRWLYENGVSLLSWSPDGNWIAGTQIDRETGIDSVMLISLDSSEIRYFNSETDENVLFWISIE